MRRALATTLGAAFALLCGLTPTSHAVSVDCLRPVNIPGVGPACRMPDGLYEMAVDRGTGLRVHGPDPAPAAPMEPEAGFVSVAPECTTDQYRVEVLYAYPPDVSSQYASRLGSIRDLMSTINGRLRDEAEPFAETRDFEVLCDAGGLVQVTPVQTFTSSGSDSFNSIVGDLRSRGYTDKTKKYLVWYEGSVGPGVGGTGHVYVDDRPDASNLNNGGGNTTSMFAVQFGAAAGYQSRVWMHELSHTLGAVQNTAPHTTGNMHCNDGSDVMCYDDNGPTSNYNSNICTDAEHYDCNHDDYFNPNPAPGSYLDTHWNIASTANRYLKPGVIVYPSLDLSPTAVVQPEPGGAVTFTVSRGVPRSTTSTVQYQAVSGTATAGSDFVNTAGTLNFAPGQTTAQFTVPVINDSLVEADETFRVGISNPTNGIIGSATATVTIVDDDVPPPQIYFGTPGPTPESGFSIPVVRSPARAETSSAVYQRSDGRSGVVVFPPGATSASIQVTDVDNDVWDPAGFTLGFTLSSPSKATIGSPASVQVLVSDDDTRPVVRFTGSAVNLEEGRASTVVVQRLGARGNTVTANLRLNFGSASPSDVSLSAASVTLVANETQKAVTLTPTQDTLSEGPETFELEIASAVVAQIGSPSTVSGEIAASDLQPDLVIDGIGQGQYNISQTSTRAPVPGLTQTFDVDIRNDNPFIAAFTLKGTGADDPSTTIRYFIGGQDVTPSMTGGGFLPTVAAHTTLRMRVEMTSYAPVSFFQFRESPYFEVTAGWYGDVLLTDKVRGRFSSVL